MMSTEKNKNDSVFSSKQDIFEIHRGEKLCFTVNLEELIGEFP